MYQRKLKQLQTGNYFIVSECARAQQVNHRLKISLWFKKMNQDKKHDSDNNINFGMMK